MALVTERIWRSGTRKVRRAVWGYTVQLDGKQARCFREDWTKEDAEKALAARLLGVAPAGTTAPADGGLTFGVMVEKFLTEKRSEGKRSIEDDEEWSEPLKAFFGVDTPLSAITTRRVAEYRVSRLATTSRRGGSCRPRPSTGSAPCCGRSYAWRWPGTRSRSCRCSRWPGSRPASGS
jgi:hypothetical protein